MPQTTSQPVSTIPSTDAIPSDRLTTKSVLRYRPLGTTNILVEPPRVARASRSVPALRSRLSRSVAHADIQTNMRRSPRRAPSTTSEEVPVWKQRTTAPVSNHAHSLVLPIGVGMLLAMIAVFVGQLLIGWVGNAWNDWHYGYPRTYQGDAVVGHHDSSAHPSHFLVLNLKGQIDVIEFPGGDVSQAKVYVVARLAGPQAALVPVTLRFVPNAQTHLLDMLVSFGRERVVYRNAQGTFHASSTSG